jgi:radical SAM-linked protein
MTEPERHRYRLSFSKEDPMRFTGHLDLHHSWERTLRRAGIPVEHTRGYNPRMRISLGLALPLGYSSECELIDVWLNEPRKPGDLLTAVQHAAPPGLIIHTAQEIEAKTPTLQKQILSATYEAHLPQDPSPVNLPERIQEILSSPQLPRQRRGKDYDLRPLVESLEIHESEDDGTTLVMRLAARPGATGRPDEVLLALGHDPLAARIHRKALHLETM